MRATPKTIQPPRSELDKPAKERIIEQADRLFTGWGVNISMETIAHVAHTNVATIIKHFGHRERLVSDFLKSLVKQADQSWKHIEQEHPNDPESQLRRWILQSEFAADLSNQHEHAQLARAAVDLIGIKAKNPLLVEIESFWQAERRKITKLCEQAKFRDPAVLADKLLLLVQGARNERACYGYAGPSGRVGEAGDDLMVAHGAQRKPLMEV
jgi:AcrR family transcriptional regulator